MKKTFLWIHKRIGVLTIGLLAVFMIGIGLLMNSYALNEPVPKIIFSSQTLSYEENDSGSWKVDKSAEWIGEGKARITFQVDTVLRTGNPNTDVILVLDISGSMSGNKLERVKQDSINLLDSLLSNPNNQAALITFDTGSVLVSDFTNDKDSLIGEINHLEAIGTTNYYQPLVHVDEILKDYSKKEDTECVVLFLTDGYPNEDIPNQIGEYKYLKSEYSWLNIHGVQYEMGEEVLDPIKKVSDKQFIADMTTLNNVLFDASVLPIPYDKFILTDWIHNEYFDLKEISNIQPSFGEVKLEDDNGVPKVTWDLSGLVAGQGATLTIDIDLKGDSYTGSEINPTNKSSEVVSQIDGDKEDVTTKESPSLKTHYKVIYDGNAPSGCSVGEVPEAKDYAVYETVGKSDAVPICEGYQFKGWEIVTEEVKQLNGDYFQMPEKDVTLRAEWGRMGLSKSVEGEVYVQKDPILQKIDSDSYNKELWKYKNSITKIVFEGEQTSKTGSTEELTWDISEAKDWSVRGLLVPNSDDSSTYTAYIQGLEGRVIANSDSSYLFGSKSSSTSFTKLTAIEGLKLLDTSQVTDMAFMFCHCESLTSVGNISGWDVRQVTDMAYMFSYCYALTSLDLSGWNTSRVKGMSYMFMYCKVLTSVGGISGWDTRQVTAMYFLFDGCSALKSLDLSGWNTSLVTNMGGMFSSCSSLTSVGDLSGWETGQVTNMSFMFDDCEVLTSVGDISAWDTRRVTNMSSMFTRCYVLTTTISILSNSVASYDLMFYSAATKNNAKITVNYSSESEALVNQMIATKSDGCNVVKASSPYVAHSVTIQGRNDIIATPSNGMMFTRITLTPINEDYMVTSFEMNGTKIEGNTFVMPNGNAMITNVTTGVGTVFESNHNPYDNNLDDEYEHTFEGATSLTVTLEYQTEEPDESMYDWIALYDRTGKEYGKYGRETKTTETIVISGDYVKLLFHTDEFVDGYYGFKATVVPNYE